MALTAKYVKPLQIVATQKMRDEVAAIADAEERSLADVLRELIQAGLDTRSRRSRK